MPNFIKDCCPVCNCGSYSVIGKPDLGTANIKKPDDTLIVKCKSCGTIYCNPLPIWTAEDFGGLYNGDYFAKEDNEIRLKRKTPERRFKVITKYLKSKSETVLEFGAGIYPNMTQYLLNITGARWTADIQEPSVDFVNKLKEKYPHTTIIESSFLDMHTTKKYSLIYADSVIEHVHNPVDYIKKCADLLEPGGIFYFISPNEHSFINFLRTLNRKIQRKPVSYLCPYTGAYHLFGFSRKSIKIMAEKSGLRLIKIIRRYDYMAQNIIKKRNVLYFPAAVVAFIIDLFGFGTNQEILLRKE